MRFEWDERKARRNAAKHGVTFELAITVFDAGRRLFLEDTAHSTGSEVREQCLGQSDNGVLLVVFTRRQGGTSWRIISARRASRRERKKLETEAPDDG